MDVYLSLYLLQQFRRTLDVISRKIAAKVVLMVVGDERLSDGKAVLFGEADNCGDIPGCIHHQCLTSSRVTNQIGEVLHRTNFNLFEIKWKLCHNPAPITFYALPFTFFSRSCPRSSPSPKYSGSPRFLLTQRERTKNRSLKRLTYCNGLGPISSSRDKRKTSRSARRHTVRAWWRNPLTLPPPGRMNELSGVKSFCNSSMSFSRALTSSSPTLNMPS